METCSNLLDVTGLGALLSLDDLKLYLVAFLQALVTFVLNGAVMDENIRSVIATNKSEAFGIVEPLHCTFQTRHVLFLRTPGEWEPGLSLNQV